MNFTLLVYNAVRFLALAPNMRLSFSKFFENPTTIQEEINIQMMMQTSH